MKNCPDCMTDENAVGEGVRCAAHEIVYLRSALDEETAARKRAEESWRCFHCGETFTVEAEAKDHFGIEGIPPMCVDPLTKDEKARMVVVRKLESELVKWRKENEELDHQAGSYHAMTLELGRYFGQCAGFPVKTAHQAFLVYEAMIGRAEAAESRALAAEQDHADCAMYEKGANVRIETLESAIAARDKTIEAARGANRDLDKILSWFRDAMEGIYLRNSNNDDTRICFKDALEQLVEKYATLNPSAALPPAPVESVKREKKP